MSESLFKELNKEQKEAVRTTEGPLLIIAGAGSGKTRALTHRVGYLLAKGIAAQNILALTFTNKAAEEMQERVKKLTRHSSLKTKSGLPFIGTFHALGAKILRVEITRLGFSGDFFIYDKKDQVSLIKELMAQHNFSQEQFKPAGILATISRQKNELISADEYSQKASEYYEKVVAQIYNVYQQALREANAVDFDDLLVLPVTIFKKFPALLASYQSRFTHILVDEYQDTNNAQYVFLRMLAEKHKNLCVVGDDWQSVYAFRGADFRNILNFEKDYPQAKVVFLEENYRSSQNILNAAQAVIEKNVFRTQKRLWTQKPPGEKIRVIRVASGEAESDFVVSEIEKIIKEKPSPASLSKSGASRGGPAKSLKDVVVLYRTNAQSRLLEERLVDSGLPYKIVGSVRFYERREIKDIIAYLRLLQNPGDNMSLKRIVNVPPRGIGKIKLEKILSGEERVKKDIKVKQFYELIEELREVAKSTRLSSLVKLLTKKIKYKDYIKDGTQEGESRWENVLELMTVAAKFDYLDAAAALVSFLEEIALLTPSDEVDTKNNVLNLMTLHSVKGLEFSVVFIVGFEEGLLPHSRAALNPQELEEERRLCYVGITRSQKRVYLVFTKKRNLFGSTQATLPSRFLEDIPAELVEFEEYEDRFL